MSDLFRATYGPNCYTVSLVEQLQKNNLHHSYLNFLRASYEGDGVTALGSFITKTETLQVFCCMGIWKHLLCLLFKEKVVYVTS